MSIDALNEPEEGVQPEQAWANSSATNPSRKQQAFCDINSPRSSRDKYWWS